MTDYRKLCAILTRELEAWNEFGEQLKELTKKYERQEMRTNYWVHTAIKELNNPKD